MAANPPNVITLRDLIAQRQKSGERFHLSEVVSIVVPICTDIAQRQARGETVYVHASAIGAGLDGVPRLIPNLAKHKPREASDQHALAPELATSAPTTRSSVFGIGAVVYEMLTLHAIGQGMKPPSAIVSGLPPIVDTILAKALVTDPLQRPDDLPAFAQAIHHFAPTSVAPPPNVDETAFEVELDLRSSMLPPGGVNLANPVIPKNEPVRVSAPLDDDPFAAVLGPPAAHASSESTRPGNRAVEELNSLKARLEADPAPRWIVVKDKMDHGPFAAIELLQQIASDTFRPDDILVDTHNSSRTKIKEHPEFSRFAHHANLRREEVKEKKEVVALEKSEGRRGAAKGVIGVIAVVAVLGIVGFVIWKIKGKADEDARRRKEQEAISLAGEGSIAGKEKAKPKWGGGGGGGGYGAGGSNADEALKKSLSDYDAETLMPAECSAPVGGGIAGGCGLSGSARAKIVVQNGKCLGVTVTTDPSQPGVNSCMEGRIRGLSWKSVPGTSVCIRTFKAN